MRPMTDWLKLTLTIFSFLFLKFPSIARRGIPIQKKERGI